MEKIDLVKILDEVFVPIGFKRKGNYWVSNEEELSKVINLQKSNYGNSFYINYGFIIKGLELTTKAHIDNRLASTDKDQQARITSLLDFETLMDEMERREELKQIILEKIVPSIQAITTKRDILKDLQDREHLYDIPLVVKKYFNLN